MKEFVRRKKFRRCGFRQGTFVREASPTKLPSQLKTVFLYKVRDLIPQPPE
jgi:hypothetical protein